MSQKGQTGILLLAGLVLLLTLGGGIFYLGRVTLPHQDSSGQAASKTQPQNAVTSSPQPSPTLSPTTTPDETANWKTYTNKEFSFSFQYPPNLKLRDSKDLSRSDYKSQVTFINLSSGGQLGFNFSLEPNPKNLTPEKWLSQRREEEKVNCEIDCLGFSNPYQNMTIAGKSAIIQNLASVVPTFNVYLPINKYTILWATAVNTANFTPTEVEEKLLISILETLKLSVGNI